MYSREKHMKAIDLYIKYNKSTADTIHELGYLSRKMLSRWYAEYLKEKETGVWWDQDRRCLKFSMEQKTAAVQHYLEHGRNFSRTVRSIGYPSRELLHSWCNELAPGTRKRQVGGIQYTQEQKKEAVIALCTRIGNVKDITKEFGVTREAIYNWKNDLLRKDDSITMPKAEDNQLHADRETLYYPK